MKFRFCGEGDCPDWVLAEIISTLSNLSIENLEELSDLVALRICGQSLEETKIKALTSSLTNEGKTAVACIDFMLISAARYSCTESIFGEEIQQLGLPKDHAAAMCRVLQKHSAGIQQTLKNKAFKINELQSVRKVTTPGRLPSTFTTLEVKISQELVDGLPKDTTHVFSMDRPQMEALLAELKLAREVMQKYENKTGS
ncbi:COMM domain-containing protein 4 [Drosophila eugracilis]|uniref:COMM domain-containing protein 4 n=1 Tax=Drosophila eugracilis TaxID=29029 RepID=UPI0007E7ACD3|nr:COMM domain-containing protein 4 [Drosophila eugracilis]